jgi:hypothetical protein
MRLSPYFEAYWSQKEHPVNFTIENNVLIKVETMASRVVVPDGVTAIGPRAFEGCLRLTGIRLPDTVESLGEHAFLFCKSLTEVHIPEKALQGYSLMGAMSLFDDTYFNHPGMAYRYVARMLDGKADYSEGFRKLCLSDLTQPFSRSRWVAWSVEEDKPQWLTQILELNDRLPLEELEHHIAFCVQAEAPQFTAILLNYKNTHYTPEEIAAEASDPLGDH